MKQSLKLYCVTGLISLLAIGCSKDQFTPEPTTEIGILSSGKFRPSSPKRDDRRPSPAKEIQPKFKLSAADQQALKATPWALKGMIATLKTQTIPSLKQRTIQLEKSKLRHQEVVNNIYNIKKTDEIRLKVKNSTITTLKQELLLDAYPTPEAREAAEKKLTTLKADYNSLLSIYEENDKTLGLAENGLMAIEKDIASTTNAWIMAEEEQKAYEMLLKE